MLFRSEILRCVGQALTEFPDRRGEYILRQRFGLDGNEPRTLEEIGQKLNLSRERVRQIEARALEHLRGSARSKRGPLGKVLAKLRDLSQ